MKKYRHLTGEQEAGDVASRPLARADYHPEAHPARGLRRLRVGAGHRHRQDVQERERGGCAELRARLHRGERRVEPKGAVGPVAGVLLQRVRRIVPHRTSPSICRAGTRSEQVHHQGVEERRSDAVIELRVSF